LLEGEALEDGRERVGEGGGDGFRDGQGAGFGFGEAVGWQEADGWGRADDVGLRASPRAEEVKEAGGEAVHSDGFHLSLDDVLAEARTAMAVNIAKIYQVKLSAGMVRRRRSQLKMKTLSQARAAR